MKNPGLQIGLLLSMLFIPGLLKAGGGGGKKPNLPQRPIGDNFLGQENLPRGIRNNNPGNLALTKIQWQGKVPNDQNTDGRFEQFTNYLFGVRALVVNLKTWLEKRELDTIRLIVTRYAPPSENDTEAYINFVAQTTGFKPDQKLVSNKETYLRVAQAISAKENGMLSISNQDFERAWKIL